MVVDGASDDGRAVTGRPPVRYRGAHRPKADERKLCHRLLLICLPDGGTPHRYGTRDDRVDLGAKTYRSPLKGPPEKPSDRPMSGRAMSTME
jgi:hypothetical protein